MSNYYEPKKRESTYMGDEDDWRVLWPKNVFKTTSNEGFEAVFGKVPKEPAQPKPGSIIRGQKPVWNYGHWEFRDLEGNVIKTKHDTGSDNKAAQPVVMKKHTDGTMTIQVGGSHYKDKAMQPWDIIDAWELNFYAGNVVKYILRYRYKDGLQDLQKARHYIDKLIEDYADPT